MKDSRKIRRKLPYFFEVEGMLLAALLVNEGLEDFPARGSVILRHYAALKLFSLLGIHVHAEYLSKRASETDRLMVLGHLLESLQA